jgi:DNA-binding transcriptional ArsR family regulator
VPDPRSAPDLLAVLAEPNRRRLLELLREGERTVTELAAHFTVTRPAVSQHLGVLASAGLVDVRQDGRFRRYRIDPAGMAVLRSTLEAFWTAELEALASAAAPSPVTPPSTTEKGNRDDD